MAMHARPVPTNPYNPNPHLSSLSVSVSAVQATHDPNSTTTTNQIRYPSPFVPIRLPIFALVLWINDRVVRLLSVGSNNPRRSSPSYSRGTTSPRSSSSSIPLATFNSGGRNRGMGIGIGALAGTGLGLSDDTAESVEEGVGIGIGGGAGAMHQPHPHGINLHYGRTSAAVSPSLSNTSGRRVNVVASSSSTTMRKKAD